MKIGIVTFYDDNFGTCLQAFGLLTTITGMHHEAEIIKYTRSVKNGLNKSRTKRLIKKLVKFKPKDILKYLVSYNFIKNRKSAYSLFRQNHLKFSKIQLFRGDDMLDIAGKYDKFVCGSDMIFSEEFHEDWSFLYLGFAPKSKTIAYAPSFGKNEICDEFKGECCNFLMNINHLSCREVAGVSLIKKITGRDIPQVLDPTLLIDRSRWDNLIGTNKRIIEEPYTLTYVFGGVTGGREEFFNDFSKAINCRHVILPMNQKQERKEKLIPIGPIEFVHLFRDAEYIITDTFHGMIFSIIMNKPFLVLEREDKGHWAKYSDRMTSTLEKLDLQKHYVNSSFRDFQIAKEIDYAAINDKLEELKKLSLQYLEGALSNE